MELGREAVGAQVKLQPQVGVEHDPERHDRRRPRQAQRREAPQLNVDGVEPHDVVRQRRPARKPELRAHDARHDEHAQPRIGGRRPAHALRERSERPILAGAEVVGELLPAFPAREPSLDLRIAPGEAVVGGDVIER